MDPAVLTVDALHVALNTGMVLPKVAVAHKSERLTVPFQFAGSVQKVLPDLFGTVDGPLGIGPSGVSRRFIRHVIPV